MLKLKRSFGAGSYKAPKKQIAFFPQNLRKIRRDLYDKRTINSEGHFVFDAHPPLISENRLYVEWDNHEITRAVDSRLPTWIVDLDSLGDSSGLRHVITLPIIGQHDQLQNQEKSHPWGFAGTAYKDQTTCQFTRRDDGLSSTWCITYLSWNGAQDNPQIKVQSRNFPHIKWLSIQLIGKPDRKKLKFTYQSTNEQSNCH